MRQRLAFATVVFAALFLVAPFSSAGATGAAGVEGAAGTEQAAAPADDGFVPPADLGSGWYARIETDRGRILVRLLPYQAPQSVAHFAALAEGRLSWFDPVTGEEFEQPYYDGTLVEKAVAAERFEAGEKTADGRRAPALYVPQEGGGPVNFFLPYRVGMTRASGGRISAVKFFVTAASQPLLTPRHPCFGEVVAGHRIVDEIATVKTYSNGRPIEPVVLEAVRIFKVGEPAPLPEPEPYFPKPLELRLNDGRKPR